VAEAAIAVFNKVAMFTRAAGVPSSIKPGVSFQSSLNITLLTRLDCHGSLYPWVNEQS
jgi:hypothetical protein